MTRELVYRSQRVRFPALAGHPLAGIIEWPRDKIRAHAIFTHCFTCTKDLKAIVRVSRHLAHRGVAVLRFDFTGLGESGGNFVDTTFYDNVADVQAAYQYMQDHYAPPDLLVGHSLGGAAILATAAKFDQVRLVATIAAPSTTQHLAATLTRMDPSIEHVGHGEVEIGGRRYPITKDMIEVLRHFDLPRFIREYRKPLTIFFSPQDETLPFEHALDMLTWSGGPARLINLRNANHLLTNHPHHAPQIAHHLAP